MKLLYSYNNMLELVSFRGIVLGTLFLIEFILLGLVVLEEYKLAAAVIIMLAACFVLYKFFANPFVLLVALLLGILGGQVELSATFKIAFTDLLFPLLLVVFAVRSYFDGDKYSGKEYYIIKFLFSAFLVWSLFVVLVAANKPLALAYWRNYFAGFMVFLYALTYIREPAQIRAFLTMLVVWGLTLSFIEFFIVATLGEPSTAMVKLFLNKNLLSTSWGRSNYFATFHVMIIPITIGYLFSTPSRKTKLLLSVSLLIMFSAIILTLSRGGMLSLLVATLVLISRVLKPKTFIPILGLIAIIAVILLLNPLTSLLFQGIGSVEKNLSTYTRLNFYEDVWKTFLKYPVTGVGMGNLGYYSLFTIKTFAASAHNIVLGVMGETGIVGAILYISMLGYALLQSFRNYLKEKIEHVTVLMWAFFCSFLGVLAHSMIEPNFEGFQFSILFWAAAAAFFRFSEFSDSKKLNLWENSESS